MTAMPFEHLTKERELTSASIQIYAVLGWVLPPPPSQVYRLRGWLGRRTEEAAILREIPHW